MTSKLPIYLTPLLFSLGISSLSAVTTTWTGALNDGVWASNGNWDNSTVAFGGLGIFSGTPTTPMPSVNSNRVGVAIEFQTAGWTIENGGGSLRMDSGNTSASYELNSNGAGVNTINATVTTTGSPAFRLNVGTGNTLQLSGTYTFNKLMSLSGNGTLVFDGTAQTNSNFNIGYNLSDNLTILANSTLSMGAQGISGPGTWGGTAGYVLYNSTTYTFNSGNTIAPGGNGTYGSEISTLSFLNTGATTGGKIVLDGANVNIQIGTSLGENDKIDHVSERINTSFTIQNSATLNLFGSSIEDGNYTIVSSASPLGIVGTFTNVNFNGSPINPSNFTVNYGANNITVDITGVVPEPSTYALLAGIAMLGFAAIRRRK